MTPEQWQTAKQVLLLAGGRPLAEQEQIVRAAFPDDPLVQADVIRLLQATTQVRDTTRPPDPAYRDEALPLLASGNMCGPYRVLQSIGAGGMGQVFLAEDIRAQMPGIRARHVALKCPTGRWVESPDARYRLLLEFATAAALGTHPHIATAFDALDAHQGQSLILVMEYVDGTPLNRLTAKGPMAWRFALGLGAQIVEAVGHAHDSNILHCDIKSANVMVTTQNRIKVLDFGLSRARQLPGSDGARIGTLAYMPPERIIDGTLDVSGDLYSVGITLFEMLTGRRPFVADEELDLIAEILDAEPPRPSALVPGLPHKIDQILARTLAKDPRERYQTAREMTAALNAVLHKRERTWAERAVLALAGVVALTAVVLFLGFVSSTTINVGLGRTGGFEPDLQRSMIAWGGMSLTAPLLFLASLLLGLSVLAIALQLLYRGVPPIRKQLTPLVSRCSAWLTNTAGASAASVDQAVLLAQIVLLAAFIWYFGTLIAGVAHFTNASAPGSLNTLSPSHVSTHELYRGMVSILLFVLAASSLTLLGYQLANGGRPSVATMVSLMTLVIGLFLFALPFQVLFHNKAERVLHAGEACYLVGRNAEGQVRLFCPRASSTRTRAVAADDPRLIRSGVVESVFAELDRVVDSGTGVSR